MARLAQRRSVLGLAALLPRLEVVLRDQMLRNVTLAELTNFRFGLDGAHSPNRRGGFSRRSSHTAKRRRLKPPLFSVLSLRPSVLRAHRASSSAPQTSRQASRGWGIRDSAAAAARC